MAFVRPASVICGLALLAGCSEHASLPISPSAGPDLRFAVPRMRTAAPGPVTLRGLHEGSGDPLSSARTFLRQHHVQFGLDPTLLDLRLLRTTRTPGGTRLLFGRTHQGTPIFGGEILVGLDNGGAVIHVHGASVGPIASTARPTLTSQQAFMAVLEYLPDTSAYEPPSLWWASPDASPAEWRLAFRVKVIAQPQAAGAYEVYVDAQSGDLVRMLDRLWRVGPPCTPCNPTIDVGCGSLFFVNPVDGLDNTLLWNGSNVDAGQTGCVLENLTSATLLTGTFANTSLTFPRVAPPYDSLRSVNESAVDEVTAYYHVDRAKRHLDVMGYPGVMAFSLDINARNTAFGYSYYDTFARAIHLGATGVDDATDPDVVYHEYGHAIQSDQIPGFGTTLAALSIGEGFADYFGTAMTDTSFATVLGPPCLGSWFATDGNPYTGFPGSGCVRRVDGTKLFPDELVFQSHADGEIWSSALWALRSTLGATTTDALVIEGHTFMTPSGGFLESADALLSADVALNAGANGSAIHLAMAARGIPRTATPASSSGVLKSVAWVCESPHNYFNQGYTQCIRTIPGADRMRLRFSSVRTGALDVVRISDGSYNEVQRLAGLVFGGGQGFSASVVGDTIVARFKADLVGTDWGFRIDRVYYSTPCTVDADCDDGDACNGAESCQGAACVGGTTLSCDDGVFCNGAEICVAGAGCFPGPDPADDGVACTVDSCDELAQGVANTPDDGACDDAVFCNGAETCDPALGCQPGTPLVLDDGIACTVDECEEALGMVTHTPADAPCDDLQFCNGVEECDATLGCQAGAAPEVDDGIACTLDSCDEGLDLLTHVPDDGACDDGLFCNGTERCEAATGCVPGLPVPVDDGVSCTVDGCDEVLDLTTHRPDDGLCDDGKLCNGVEWCDPTLDCQAGVPPPVDDGVSCTVDRCDAALDEIVHSPDDTVCSDGLFCNGDEVCDPSGGCRLGPPRAVDDGLDCTLDRCDEATGQVVHQPIDSECDDGLFCNGMERCDVSLGCTAGEPPRLPDGDGCTIDACDEVRDVVTHEPSPSCGPPPIEPRGCSCDATTGGGGAPQLFLAALLLVLGRIRERRPGV